MNEGGGAQMNRGGGEMGGRTGRTGRGRWQGVFTCGRFLGGDEESEEVHREVEGLGRLIAPHCCYGEILIFLCFGIRV